MRKLFLLSGFSFAFISGFAQLNGTYTVDQSTAASATNYQSVNAAISDMTTGTRPDGGPVNGPGVSAAVTIRLVTGSGPYTEQVILPAIAGASVTNTIRITGGPGREMITYSATTTAQRQVVKLDGARHIILDSLTLLNTGATYGYGVHITNAADSNVVSNCSVITNNTSTSANFAGITISGATVASNGDFGDDNLIQNNTVNGGYYGISMRGTSTTVFSQRNRVIGNTVLEYYYYGVYCYYENLTEIIDNSITARVLTTTAGTGIYLYYADRFNVERNTVVRAGGDGLYCYYGNYQGGTGTQRARIVNNMIGGGFASTVPYGIYLATNSRYIDVWHNSVSVDNGNGRALYITGGTGNNVQNNSFAVFGSSTGYAAYISSATYVTTVDYNNYYVPGSANFIYIGAAYSIATYIGGGGFNANSRQGNPVYQNNANNLHTSAVQLYDGGTNLGVTTDIDGDVRPMAPTTFYDIGADEYVQVLNDAGVVSSTSPVIPFAAGVQNVGVVLFNYGANTLTSATVNWDVNTVLQAPFAWTGSVPTYTSSSPATIGTYNFAFGTTYNIRVWTSNPNGSSDQQILNDTLYFTVCTALNGVYDIGGASPDFPTISAAVSAMACGGILGPVTLNLAQGAGPFNEQVIIPSIAGSSALNTVRINGGANREIVQYTATNTNERAVFKLNGADYFILDSMRIINNGTTYGYGVQFTNSADNNTIHNCYVQVSTTSTSSNFAGITLSAATVATNADNGDNNIIEDNTVNGGYYSVTMRGLSTTVFDQSNIVRRNTLQNFYYYGLYCYYQNLTVVENNIVSARPTASTAGYGFYMYYADRFTIEENDLDSIGGNGIYTYYGNYQGGTGTQRARIANNMVGGAWRDATSAYGIYLSTNSRYVDVWHNSVSMNGTSPRALYITSGTGNDVRNNSFAAFGSTTGYAAYITNQTYVTQFNYNNYYIPGSANFIYISGAYSAATFVGGGGWNANSVNVNPMYTSNANDLHTTAVQLYDAGANVGIVNDFDGDMRPLAPSVGYDIGADEFSVGVNDNDVVQILTPINGQCPDSSAEVSVVITNLGLNTITSMPITAQITGYTTATLNTTYTGPLAFGQSDTVIVGTFNSYPGGTLSILAYSTLASDQNVSNDSASATITITTIAPAAVGSNANTCSGTSASLSVNTDGFSHMWYDAAVGGNIVGSGDAFTTPALSATTTYYVQTNGTCPNPVRTPITVTVIPSPVVTLGNDTAVCQSYVLDAGNPSMTWLWSTSATTQMITVTSSGQYFVAVNDGTCTGRDTINITVNPNPVLTTSVADGNICLGESDTMYVSGAMLYNWSSGGIGTMEIVTPMTTTQYTVYGLDANGCTDTDTLNIVVNNPTATLSLPLDTACTQGGSVTLSGESPAGGTWSGTAVTGNSFDPLAAGVGMHAITYTYTDANGCTAIAVDSMWVDLCSGIAESRDAIIGLYPNPSNGEFTLQLGGTSVVNVVIVDALGQVVFAEQKNAGTHRITLSSAGLYLVVVSDEKGNRWSRNVIVE
jgi:hypothetical protein